MTVSDFDRLLRQAALYTVQHYPGEQARIGRGLELALNMTPYFYYNMEGKQAARVRSATDPEVEYVVVGTQCDCPDFQKAPGGRCKHRFAVMLTRMAEARADMVDAEKEN